jgi:hypothetical protein
VCSFHDYILAGFVHCNCASSVPEGKFIIGGKLRLTPSRVYGRNPFGARVTLALDMVRDVTRAATCGASQSTSLVVTLLWMRACSTRSYVRLWVHSAWARGWMRSCVTRVCWCVRVQSYAFGDNVVLQASDLHAAASWANIGVVEGCLSGRPRSVVFNLAPAAVKALTCSRDMHFRVRAVFASSGKPFTNLDDR